MAVKASTQLDILEQYLKSAGIKHERIDRDRKYIGNCVLQYDWHQIKVLDDEGNYLWDAVCHFGSYGYEQGLLEIYGSIADEDDPVVGWLTAQDVIDRIGRADDKT